VIMSLITPEPPAPLFRDRETHVREFAQPALAKIAIKVRGSWACTNPVPVAAALPISFLAYSTRLQLRSFTAKFSFVPRQPPGNSAVD